MGSYLEPLRCEGYVSGVLVMNWGSTNTYFLEIDDSIRDHSYKRVSMMCRRVVRPR